MDVVIGLAVIAIALAGLFVGRYARAQAASRHNPMRSQRDRVDDYIRDEAMEREQFRRPPS